MGQSYYLICEICKTCITLHYFSVNLETGWIHLQHRCVATVFAH